MKTLIAVLAAASLSTAGEAANCWTADGIEAARVSEFNAAMMVTTLRCALINVDIKTSYDAFTAHYRDKLRGADDRLKQYFLAQGGAGERNYRAFYTQIGNRYGAAKTDGTNCTLFAAVAKELASTGTDEAALAKYAAALVPNPAITGDKCKEMAAKP